jgi:hypothetical protein
MVFLMLYCNKLFTSSIRNFVLVIFCISSASYTHNTKRVSQRREQVPTTNICYFQMSHVENTICGWTFAFHYWYILLTIACLVDYGYQSINFQRRPHLAEPSHEGQRIPAPIHFYVPPHIWWKAINQAVYWSSLSVMWDRYLL